MPKILFSLAAIFVLLVFDELAWRRKKISDEMARKIVHITGAVFVAFWPFYMSYKYIQLIAIAFIIVITISRYFHIFRGLVHVKRKTFGDYFAPISIFILATLAPNKYIFAMALLNIGLADGIAALAGKKYGKKNQYKIDGQLKSFAGTFAFAVVSLVILLSFKLLRFNYIPSLSWVNVVILPPILAMIENVSTFGADDLTIPLVLLVCLRWL